MNKNCVLGFFFNPSKDKVLLILKNRPDFLKGLYNGIGGKVEKGEKYINAIKREFKEETGIDIEIERWVHYHSMFVEPLEGNCYYIQSYYCVAKTEEEFYSFSQTTDEKVSCFNSKNLPPYCFHNLEWLIPLALNKKTIKSSSIYNFKTERQ